MGVDYSPFDIRSDLLDEVDEAGAEQAAGF